VAGAAGHTGTALRRQRRTGACAVRLRVMGAPPPSMRAASAPKMTGSTHLSSQGWDKDAKRTTSCRWAASAHENTSTHEPNKAVLLAAAHLPAAA
jgi:hypothetical protein